MKVSKKDRLQMIETAYRQILVAIGEDPDREGLRDTPNRVARMYLNELTVGTGADLTKELGTTFEEEHHDELVIVKDIPFSSLCEHHTVPFIGKVSIGYVPNGKIVGLSKLARLVEVVSKTLSVQERLTSQIANTIMTVLSPKGVIVIIEAEHMCMTIRGIKKPGTTTTTSAVRGIFETDSTLRMEFLTLIK